MNNLSASVALNSSNNRLNLERSIRDTIFYYEDLMGLQENQSKTETLCAKPETEPEHFMAECFDEAMFDHQVCIKSKDREQKIQQLLKSIEAFQSEHLDIE